MKTRDRSQIRPCMATTVPCKTNLVEFGFRLPSALDNRPLNFDEFPATGNQTIYVSATPGDYELEQTGGVIVEQVVRPTGLLDPPLRSGQYQPDRRPAGRSGRAHQKGERVLATTLQNAWQKSSQNICKSKYKSVVTSTVKWIPWNVWRYCVICVLEDRCA